MSEKYISLENLKEYNEKIKETYIKPLEDRIDAIQESIVQPQVNVTWAELKDLRDNAQLVPGQFYRITDYQCTTTQEDTRAMNHQFDIIIQALSENQLSENASADYHEGDTYFSSIGGKPIIPYYFIMIDPDMETQENNGDYFTNKDRFVERGYLENAEGKIVPVLYKTGNEYLDNEVDYNDPYFYMGREEYEGVTYDKWRHIEYNSGGWDSVEQVYLYTNIIIADDGYTFLTDDSIVGEKIANLNAWELKYCLDNDTDRFAWATSLLIYIDGYWFRNVGKLQRNDIEYYKWRNEEWNSNIYDDAYYLSTKPDLKVGDYVHFIEYSSADGSENAFTEENSVVEDAQNGKGVIYYMKDEWNNECPYDFKNIVFSRDGFEHYTFDRNLADISFNGLVYNNAIGICYDENNRQILNQIIIAADDEGYILNNIQIYNNCFNLYLDLADHAGNIIFYSGISNRTITIYNTCFTPIVYKPSGFIEIILNEEE